MNQNVKTDPIYKGLLDCKQWLEEKLEEIDQKLWECPDGFLYVVEVHEFGSRYITSFPNSELAEKEFYHYYGENGISTMYTSNPMYIGENGIPTRNIFMINSLDDLPDYAKVYLED